MPINKSKKKKSTASTSAIIGTALTPAVSAAVVPRSIDLLPKSNPSDLKQIRRLDENLAGSSLLTRSLGFDDKPYSDDTDTSLPDYANAKSTRSFSGIDTGSRQSTLKTPPPPRGFEDNYEEELDQITPRHDEPLQSHNSEATQVKRLFPDQLAAGDGNYVDGKISSQARKRLPLTIKRRKTKRPTGKCDTTDQK